MKNRAYFIKGLLAVLPLSIAVIPWGILAGSYALQVGMTKIEAQAMSALVFAGSAQLVATGMIQAGAGLGSILATVFFISARHFLYSISFRERVSKLPFRWRFGLGFLLTDELFALCNHQHGKAFKRSYALGVGLGFYVVWNIASFIGIILGSTLPNMDEYGLEFAVAATFIAIVVPMILSLSQLVCVLIAASLSTLLTALKVDGALIIASFTAMLCAYIFESLGKRRETKQ